MRSAFTLADLGTRAIVSRIRQSRKITHVEAQPINRSSGGGVLTNVTRVETFGARNTHWVSARIDADDPNLFLFEPRTVPENIN